MFPWNLAMTGLSTQHGIQKTVQVRILPRLPVFIARCFPAHRCFQYWVLRSQTSQADLVLEASHSAIGDPHPGGAQPSSSDPLSPVLLPGPDRGSQTARHSLALSSGPSPASSQASAGPTMARGRPALHSGSSHTPLAPTFRDEAQAHSESTLHRPWEAGIWQMRKQCQKG